MGGPTEAPLRHPLNFFFPFAGRADEGELFQTRPKSGDPAEVSWLSPQERHTIVVRARDVTTGRRSRPNLRELTPSEMHSKIACDYYDHDHYADNVKYVHFFAPNELGGPLPYSAECMICIAEV